MSKPSALQLLETQPIETVLHRLFPEPHAPLPDLRVLLEAERRAWTFADALAFGRHGGLYYQALGLLDPALKADVSKKLRNLVSSVLDVASKRAMQVERMPWPHAPGHAPEHWQTYLKQRDWPFREVLDPPAYCLRFVPSDSLQAAIEGDLARLRTAADNRLVMLAPSAWQLDWRPVASALQGRPVLVVVSDTTTLSHLLNEASAAEFLLQDTVGVWVADHYALPQLAMWLKRLEGKGFVLRDDTIELLDWTGMPLAERRLRELAKVLPRLLVESRHGDAIVQTEAATTAWQLGMHWTHALESHRLGVACGAELNRLWGNRFWHAPYKGRTLEKFSAYPPSPDPFAQLVEETRGQAGPTVEREQTYASKTVVTHVIGVLADGNQAASRLIRGLLRHVDRDRFAPRVLVTESHAKRPLGYPLSPHFSAPTQERAPATLRLLAELDIPVEVAPTGGRLDDIASWVDQRARAAQTEVLVCHGEDPIHYLAAARQPAPHTVYVEHSGLPHFKGFDLALCSVPGTAQERAAELARLGTRLVDCAYGVDSRDGWTEQTTPLGLPDGARVLTTISNHLEARMSPAFVGAVARVLQQVPEAVYLPMGPVNDADALRERFAPYGVAARVAFLGRVAEPSQLCRSMDLYLNEFPFGGGLALADAMAAGLPIVSTHDPQGPMQARNGAAWFGEEWTVPIDDVEGWIELAVSLLRDRERYARWSIHAIERYEARGPADYARRFEAAISVLLPQVAPI